MSDTRRSGWVGLEPTTNPESFRGCSSIALPIGTVLEQVDRDFRVLLRLELALKLSDRPDRRAFLWRRPVLTAGRSGGWNGLCLAGVRRNVGRGFRLSRRNDGHKTLEEYKPKPS